MFVQRVGGRRPLEARQGDFALGAPHPEPWQLDLPSAERHLAVDTAAAPRGPLDLVATLRATQHFPIRLHHRLDDLQTGRDAQAMECFPDTVDTPRTGSGTWIVTGRELGGWPGVFRRHASPWVAVSFLIASPVLPQDRGRSPPPASHQLKFNSVRDIPLHVGDLETPILGLNPIPGSRKLGLQGNGDAPARQAGMTCAPSTSRGTHRTSKSVPSTKPHRSVNRMRATRLTAWIAVDT